MAAEADLRRAAELYDGLGQPRLAASARQNLGFVLGLMGDVPASLQWFEQADVFFRERGIVDPRGLSDRSQALLSAGLVGEARGLAESAVEALARQGQKGYLAIAQLKLAEAALMEGDVVVAREMAQVARRAFVRQHRPSWAALARHVAVRAAWAAGERSPALLNGARAAADELGEARFVLPAADARLLAAQLALHLGRVETARRELARASRANRRGTVQLRARGWHATALLRLADGDRKGAKSALCAGVRVLERYRAALGATELRAHASGHVAEVASTGLGLALEDGAPEEVLAWMERWRAGALRMRPVRPPDDARLAADLGELRAVVAALDTALLEGRATARLRARQGELEDAVRSRARQATGILAASLAVRPDVHAINASLGGHSLVEYAEHDGVLYAVTVSRGRARLHRLGPVAEIHAELDRLLSSLRRLAFGAASPASVRAFTDAVGFGAMRLDAAVLRPVRHALAKGPLVIVPTGALHALPWSALPSCAGLPVAVAPSATVWHRAISSARGGAGGRTVLVAGPRLPGAASEVATLARRYPDAVCLTKAGAACHSVISALDGAAMAHIAAHGRFRADNPLFSSIELVDGPMTVYDLEALGRAPEVLILSACESGSSGVRPGNELMGLVAALLALGTRTVIASLIPVPDGATKALMLSLHGRMRAGASPAEALAAAEGEVAPAGPTGLAAAAAFTCFGAGR